MVGLTVGLVVEVIGEVFVFIVEMVNRVLVGLTCGFVVHVIGVVF